MFRVHSHEWFQSIFDRCYDHLRNYLYYLSGDIQWTDDAVQEVFLILWEKRGSVKDEGVLQYLLTIGRNHFLKQFRSRSVRLKFEKQQNLNDTEPSTEDVFLSEEFENQLQMAISELPEKCRTIFLLSNIDGMSNKQIAENLNVSVKAVEKQITKAYKILRERLGRY